MGKKEDRRATRSRRLIIEAWRELVLEKDPDRITISDIVERADIGRATFYAHFEDKSDLERYLFGILLSQIEAAIDADIARDDDPYQELLPSRALLRIAAEKFRWFKQNATNPETGLVMLVEPLVQRMVVRLRETDPVTLSSGSTQLDQTALFLVSGMIALLIDWLVNDMPESVETMNETIQHLAKPTLERIIPSTRF